MVGKGDSAGEQDSRNDGDLFCPYVIIGLRIESVDPVKWLPG